jgi:hypothetical protein
MSSAKLIMCAGLPLIHAVDSLPYWLVDVRMADVTG